MKKVSITCLSSTFVTTGLYFVLNYTSMAQAAKWYLFGAHLVAAILGAALGFVGVWLKQWICGVGLAVCLYFILIQLGGQ